ncbi:MAG: AraC family transcriptional regulator [Pseudomonadota bacterium]
MNRQTADVVRLSGIDMAADRHSCVNGPPLTQMPSWGLTAMTEGVEYHLHPAITYELHYQLPFFMLVHTFNGAQGRLGIGEGPLAPWTADGKGTCIIPPEVRVRIVQETPLEFLALGITPERLRRVAEAAGVPWNGHVDYYKTADPALATLSAEIRRTMIAEPLGAGGYLDTLADALLTRLIAFHLVEAAQVVTDAETLAPALARRVARWVEEDLEGPIRVIDLAERAGLSRAHFSRAFHQSFGMAPRDYILSRRIARVRTMLTETDLPISDISARCGFANPSHLTTAFRQELGLTPTAYRRALTASDKG